MSKKKRKQPKGLKSLEVHVPMPNGVVYTVLEDERAEELLERAGLGREFRDGMKKKAIDTARPGMGNIIVQDLDEESGQVVGCVCYWYGFTGSPGWDPREWRPNGFQLDLFSGLDTPEKLHWAIGARERIKTTLREQVQKIA